MSQVIEVERQLRKMILTMELGPGERLTERWAEARFNASRTPVRAAFQQMVSEGLVCREGLRWVVAPIDTYQVEQLYIYREALEVAALQISVKQLTSEQLDELEAILKCDNQGIPEDMTSDAGTKFHLKLASFCDNIFIIEGIYDALRRLSRARWLDKGPVNPAWEEHRDIILALRNQEVEKAVGLLASHLCESRIRLVSIISSSRRSLRASGVIVS
ncbi:GntR family transcriptional regulator [Klebsiella aerogenes]